MFTAQMINDRDVMEFRIITNDLNLSNGISDDGACPRLYRDILKEIALLRSMDIQSLLDRLTLAIPWFICALSSIPTADFYHDKAIKL